MQTPYLASEISFLFSNVLLGILESGSVDSSLTLKLRKGGRGLLALLQVLIKGDSVVFLLLFARLATTAFFLGFAFAFLGR